MVRILWPQSRSPASPLLVSRLELTPTTKMKIEGKTFVVTGGASGLGEGTTRECVVASLLFSGLSLLRRAVVVGSALCPRSARLSRLLGSSAPSPERCDTRWLLLLPLGA